MSLPKFREVLGNPNVQAFLQVIRYGEGTLDANGYRRCFGGELFDSFSDHPRRKITARSGSTTITSTAAGAYQFLSKTWDGLVKLYGFPDFSPANQDLGAIALIHGRKALDDVVAGRVEAAIAKCNKEWASLPGSPYGQPVISMQKALELYRVAGGKFQEFMEPVATWPFEAPEAKENEMPIASIAMAVLPTLAAKIPEIMALSKKENSAARNVDLAVKVLEVAKTAVGASSAEEVVVALDQPDKVEAIQSAVKERWFQIAEAGGGGIEGARRFNVEAAPGQPYWKQPAFAIVCLFMPVIWFMVYYVLTRDIFAVETKMTVIMAVVGVIGATTAYFLGSSFGSQKKDDVRAAKGE